MIRNFGACTSVGSPRRTGPALTKPQYAGENFLFQCPFLVPYLELAKGFEPPTL
jgi:hypothetical protein